VRRHSSSSSEKRVQDDQRAPLLVQQFVEASLEARDVEVARLVEHAERGQSAARVIGQDPVGRPVVARRQERVARLGEVDDRVVQRARSARRADDHRLLVQRVPAVEVVEHRRQELGRSGDGCVGGGAFGRHGTQGVEHALHHRQRPVVVEQGTERRVDDLRTGGGAFEGFRVQREDRIVTGTVLGLGDQGDAPIERSGVG
jgi:hypothetical protein